MSVVRCESIEYTFQAEVDFHIVVNMAAIARFCASRLGSAPRLIYNNLFLNSPRPLSLGIPQLTARVQQPAPDFKCNAVVDKQFKEIKLADYKGKYVLLFFYPLDFTFVCPTEIIAFSEAAPKFEQLNTKVIAASVDSHFSHLAWINTPRKEGGLGDMKIPILADLNKTIARNYGVLLEEAGIALRGLFLIDPKGIVKHICINDLPVGRSVDEAIRVVQAFQFVEKHGEVCPANWKPDSPTIKPDPTKAKEYFNKVN